MKIFLEYIWLDGNEPTQMRSKTKVVNRLGTTWNEDEVKDDVTKLPLWSFDGSSSKQAEGIDSDCILKPVFTCKDPFRGDPHRLVLCEVLNPDMTPHETNTRSKLTKLLDEIDLVETLFNKDDLPWFGWEQEYIFTYKPIRPFGSGGGLPLGFKPDQQPRPQGDYYCGVGTDNVIGRRITEEHLTKCVDIGLEFSGLNAEVMVGQWEYQIGPVTSLNGSDQLWISRYVLDRVAEEHGVIVSYHPKLVEGEWNGSGCHVNFSTKEMREDGGIKHILEACDKMEATHNEHIEVYGKFNDQRLTGEYETSPITDFSWGYSDRGRSIRIPIGVKNDGKGYLEDRRPSSNCDPYRVSQRMLETVYETAEITMD